MGIFDFFKGKSNAGKILRERVPLRPNALNKFELNLSDFDIKTTSAKVIYAKVSNDFYDLFPDAGKPTPSADKIELKTYSAIIFIWGKSVEISFGADVVADNIDGFIKKINKQLNWLINNEDRVNEVIIHDLLLLKNNNWLDEDQPAVSKDDFIKSIQPTLINLPELLPLAYPIMMAIYLGAIPSLLK